MAEPTQSEVSQPTDDVYAWIEQGASIHLKAVSQFGDPVELTADEARSIGAMLLDFAAELEGSEFLLCVRNDAYPASLEVRKIYRAIPDSAAASKKFVRVIDESGEEYHYPADYFTSIHVPQAAVSAFVKAQ